MVSLLKSSIISISAIILILLTLAFLSSFSASGEANETGVDVSSDEFYGQSGEPGETIYYQVKIMNTGSINDTYEIFFQHGWRDLSAKYWTTVEGLTENDQVTIPVGETKFLPVLIEIPMFTSENKEAVIGLYDVRIRAQSTTNRSVIDDVVFEIEVDSMYKVDFWSDFPGKAGILKENDATEMMFTLRAMNLGNDQDEIVMMVPNDHFCGEKKDWTAKFGTQTAKTLSLGSLEQESAVLTVTIDKNTDPGEFTLDIRAESQGDTSVYVHTTLYLNLSKAEYGLKLEKIPMPPKKVNPSDESEVEFRFTLTNTGNQDDTYTLETETPLGSGTYKGWTMEYENKDGDRVDTLDVPTGLKGNTDLFVPKNGKVIITLYLIVAIDEDEGEYHDIAISGTSDNDNAQVQYLYFNLTVILPNILVSDDQKYFFIEPDTGIQEDDTIDIHVRVFNDGSAETGEFFVVFYNGKSESPSNKAGDYITYEKVENIPAGGYTDVLATWDEIEGGENDIYVYADKPVDTGEIKTFILDWYSPGGSVIESKENDNTASINDQYQEAIDLRPDLTIAGIYFDDREAGTTTTVTVTVANIGTATARASTVQVNLKIGGTAIKGKVTKQVVPLIHEEIDPNDSIDIEFTWDIPDEEKNFTVKVTVDHEDDSDSRNDRWTRYVETESGCCTGVPGEQNIFDNILPSGMCFLYFIIIIGIIFLAGFNSSKESSMRGAVWYSNNPPHTPHPPPHHVVRKNDQTLDRNKKL